MRNIIITGAGGLVGLNLLTDLQEKHSSIIAIDKNEKRLALVNRLFPNVQTMCINLADKEAHWEHFFCNAEIIIQLHAQIQDLDPQPYHDNNVSSVEKVVRVAKKYNCKHLIHMSSSVVISVSSDLYVTSKAAGERIVVESGIPHTVLRPPLMYGCFDYKHLGFLTALMEKLPILPFPGNGRYIRQPLYVLDLCRIIQSSIEIGPKNRIHNLIGKEKIYFIDLLKVIKRKRQIHCFLLPLPLQLFAFLVKCWGMLFGRAPFVKDQVLALTAGDVFPLSNWESEFDVVYTPFDLALNEIINSEYRDFRSGHAE